MNPAPAKSPNAICGDVQAVADNLTPFWHETLQKIGLEIVTVALDGRAGSRLMEHPELWKALGIELEEQKLGLFDSVAFANGTAHCFFHVNSLGAALTLLKHQLEIRGLLGIAHIMHRETATSWRCYWSPTPGEVAQHVEDSID